MRSTLLFPPPPDTLDESPLQAEPDYLLNQRYRLCRELGHGGMGTVYLALDTYLEREVAVKIMNRQSLGTAGRTLLINEAHASARLSHPNIVMIFDVGEQDNTPYIIMEYIQGQPLSEAKLRRTEEKIRVARQICAALQHAHEKGIVHCDVKPHNVLLTSEGVAKLSDFGLAHRIDKPLSSSDSFAGTLAYIAPEQALSHPVTPSADLYALGVLLYELFTETLPFKGNSVQVIVQHLQEQPVPPRHRQRDILPALDELILYLMQKEPSARPGNAREVGQLLAMLSQMYRMETSHRRTIPA
ncbi:MAG: serine/threonine-protein kinase [Candidatus Promineifilaceae bacterium]